MNEKKKVGRFRTGCWLGTANADEVSPGGEHSTRWVRKLRTKLTLPAFVALMFVTAVGAGAEPSKPLIPSDRISVFKVPLVCPATPNIGCGSRAKPILLELEKQEAIAEAWLNREGTLLAIVWKPSANRKERKASLVRALKDHAVDLRELESKDRKAALAGFPASKEWLRASDVDRLSEEEAGIMAVRLVRKIKTIVTLDDAKAQLIQQQSAEVLARHLTGKLADGTSPREEVLKILREHLDAKDVAALKEQLKDYRPGSDQP